MFLNYDNPLMQLCRLKLTTVVIVTSPYLEQHEVIDMRFLIIVGMRNMTVHL